jgi:glycosyltransferase involved in cell wall biosynthesis
VPHALVPVYMNACDALVLTSRHEGSPTVIKEALACNLPIVTVDVGDVHQRLDPVEGCLVCANDAPETIAAGLAQVLQSGGRVAGREAVAELDERVIVQKIVDLYRAVLQQRSAVQPASSEEYR